MKILVIVTLCLMFAPFSTAFQNDADGVGEAILENGIVRTVFTLIDGAYSQIFYAWDGDGWIEILDFAKTEDVSSGGRTISTVSEVKESGGEKYVEVSGSAGLSTFDMRVSLNDGDNFFKISVDDSAGVLAPPMTSYLFKPGGKKYSETGPLDFTFTPQLKKLNMPVSSVIPWGQDLPVLADELPQLEAVIGQHTFRSPAVILQEENILAALLPDIDTLKSHYGNEPALDPTGMALAQYWAPAMDYDVTDEVADAPILSYGWCHQDVSIVYHTFYLTDGSGSAEPSHYCFYLYMDSNASAGKGFEEVVDWQWDRYGKPYFETCVLPQAADFDTYAKYAFEQADREWVDFEIDGVMCGGVPISRESDPDFWFQGWFQHLRTAYGIYIYGEKFNDTSIVERARRVLNLTLQSPNDEGPFYAIYSLADGVWYSSPQRGPLGSISRVVIPSSGGSGGVEWGRENYHTLDNSWTAYWMLRWYEDLEEDGRIVPYVRKYADFLVSHQQPSGAIPSWFAIGTLEPYEVFLESAETSTSMLLLAEFGKMTGEQKYIDAAKKAADFMIKVVFPENKWFDYETFYSCSAKYLGYYDEYTAQHPQNTLSIYWTASGMKALYESTGDPLYLDYGCRALDYLCLYQQIWAPPFLSVNGFGGFGVMNTDAEWNDARQSKFGQILLDYYEITGKPDYFERGIAAMRSAFLTMSCPENEGIAPTLYDKYDLGQGDENYCHGGCDGPGGYASFDWSTGSAMAGAAEAWNKYGSIFVDAARGNAFGLDGCIVKDVKAESGKISFKIVPMLPLDNNITIVVNGPNSTHVKMAVNGEAVKNSGILEDSKFRFNVALSGEADIAVELGNEGRLSGIIPDFTVCPVLGALLAAFSMIVTVKRK